MNNPLLQSPSSNFYIFGSEEIILDASLMLMENAIFCDNSFSLDSRLCNHLEQYIGYDITCQPSIYYQPVSGPPSSTENKSLVDYPYSAIQSSLASPYITHQPVPFSKVSTKPQVTDLDTMSNKSRKWSAEDSSRRTKKKICNGDEEKCNYNQAKDLEARGVPTTSARVKRSQKLSDRITALQKLVSPYGKTDTASVLQEASISIKLLQDQIQDLFGTSIINDKSISMQKSERNQLHLSRRGLCLVPVSLTHILTKE